MSLWLVVFFVFLTNCKIYVRKEGIDINTAFDEYNKMFHKTHSTPEVKRLRLFNFMESEKKIKELNDKHANFGSKAASFGFTEYSDMSPSEFKLTMNGFKTTNKLNASVSVSTSVPPRAIDWVAAHKTTSIKNQGQCGSCWTFSAAETVESANLMANRAVGAQHGSEQEIVDCCHADGSNGCGGGDPRAAIAWVGQVGGLELNSCYPYQGATLPCRSTRCRPAYTVRGVYPVGANEQAIYNALAHYGPLSIAVDAELWQHYNGGIINANSGCGATLDHAVQLVGYNPSHGGYWVVRNSWGPNWGEGGYILLQFGQNVCGMANYVTAASA